MYLETNRTYEIILKNESANPLYGYKCKEYLLLGVSHFDNLYSLKEYSAKYNSETRIAKLYITTSNERIEINKLIDFIKTYQSTWGIVWEYRDLKDITGQSIPDNKTTSETIQEFFKKLIPLLKFFIISYIFIKILDLLD